MSFLGPVTTLQGQLIRPHDIDIRTSEVPGAQAGTVTRLVRIGFEVRADVAAADEVTTVTLTRAEARSIDLAEGAAVWLEPAPGAQVRTPGAPVVPPEAEPAPAG